MNVRLWLADRSASGRSRPLHSYTSHWLEHSKAPPTFAQCLPRRLRPTSGLSLCRSRAQCFCHSRAVRTITHALTLSLSRCTVYSVPHRVTRILASRTAAQMTTKVSSAGRDDRHHPGAIRAGHLKPKFASCASATNRTCNCKAAATHHSRPGC